MGKNKLGHLVGNDNANAAQYIEERQELLKKGPRIPVVPPMGTLVGGSGYRNYNEKLRVTQTAYVDVKNMPIDVVADLWGVRFGVEWVEHDVVQKDELACALAQRLTNENLLEKQVTTNAVRTMYRLGATGWRE